MPMAGYEGSRRGGAELRSAGPSSISYRANPTVSSELHSADQQRLLVVKYTPALQYTRRHVTKVRTPEASGPNPR